MKSNDAQADNGAKPLTYEEEVEVAKALIKQGLLAEGYYTEEEADYMIEHSAPLKLTVAQRVLVQEFIKAFRPTIEKLADALTKMVGKR